MSDPYEIRARILALVKEFYDLAHKPNRWVTARNPRIPYAGRVFDEAELVCLVDAALDFWLTHGRYARQFEERLANFLGVSYCSLVNSGSSANLLAFAALTSGLLGDRRVRPGDEVITVAASFPTTVSPILQYGAVPVFIDITLPTYNVNVEQLEAVVTSRTRAVVLAHTLGNPFDVGRVLSICRKYDLWLVEDNCDALGSKYGGRHTGAFGHISTNSFYPAHQITTGEGGAVCTNDELLYTIVVSLRDWGRDCRCPPGRDNVCGRRFAAQHGELPFGYDHKYVYSHLGYNLKATELQAAIGCAQLEKLPGFVEARKRNFKILYHGLKDLEDRLILPEPTVGSEPAWFGFLMTLRPDSGLERDKVVQSLEAAGIQTRMLFAGNLLRQPCFDLLRNSPGSYRAPFSLETTDLVMRNAFWVGVYPGLSDSALERMILAIREAVKR